MISNGFTVEYIDIVPTPTVQQTVMLHKAAGAVIITASHNGNEWCGLKFLNPSSIFFNPEECAVLFGDLRNEPVTKVELKDLKFKNTPNSQILAEHFEHVSSLKIISLEKIRQRRFKVAFNGQCASGAVYAPLIASFLHFDL